jgi:predicted metal-dependent HD superfamily phosphohydrolase
VKADVPFELPDAVWDAIATGYAATPRWYHTLDHVAAVCRTAAGVPWERPREVFAAILFHDIVYDVTRHDNEARSAEEARRQLEGLGFDLERVCELILATARHGRIGVGEVDAEMALFLDCDMAVLGADPQEYTVYAEGVRREYLSALPVEVYDAGRKAFLAKVVAAPRLFLSERFHVALDAQARANLRAELGGIR